MILQHFETAIFIHFVLHQSCKVKLLFGAFMRPNLYYKVSLFRMVFVPKGFY